MTTAAATPARVRKQQARTASYHRVNAVYGTLELTVGEGEKAEVHGYHVEPLPSDFGPAFRCFRLDRYASQVKPGEAGTYAVLLDLHPEDADRPRHSCECLGFLRWGHKTLCKHLAALLALVRAGRL